MTTDQEPSDETLSPRWERLRQRYLALSLLLTNCIVLLLMVECTSFVALKLRGARRPNVALLKFDYAPYRMMTTEQAPWPINADGFRARSPDSYRDPPEGSFRIVFLGGSVCMGYGGENGPSLPDLLQKRLHALGLSRVEVINLGQGGAVSAQELAILIQYGLPLEPEIVVSFNGLNDLTHPRPIGTDGEPNLPYFNAQMRKMWSDAKDHSFWFAFYARTATGRVIAKIRNKLVRTEKEEVAVDRVVASYVRMMDLTRRLTAAYGIKHVVLLQPVALIDKPMSEEELRYAEQFGLLGFQERIRTLYQRSAAALSDLSAEDAFYDLTGAFREEQRTVYLDGGHFVNRIGYPRLLEVLEDEGWIEEISREYRQWEETREEPSEPPKES